MSTEMPLSAPVAGSLAASTVLPVLIAARNLLLGARHLAVAISSAFEAVGMASGHSAADIILSEKAIRRKTVQ